MLTCEKLPAIKTNVKLPDPVSNLLSELPEIEERTYFDTKTYAGIQLFKEVREQLQDSTSIQHVYQLKNSPMLAVNMKRLRPFLARVFDDRLTLTNALIISVVSFSGSMLLHALYVDLPQMQKGYNRTHFLFDTSISTRDNS